jgi:hypothetical protein
MLDNVDVNEVCSTVRALRVCRDWSAIIGADALRAPASGVTALNATISSEEIHEVISKLRWYKAPWLDKVRSAVLMCHVFSREW